MKENNLSVKKKMPKSGFSVLFQSIFKSPLLSNTEDNSFLNLKKQLPFSSEGTTLILNG